MARVRSPNYPAISLADAIQRVGQVFAKERQHPAPQEAVVKGLGYGGVNGASLGALSAVCKYGLLDKIGKDFRVSDRAVVILHPHNPMEKADAIRDASKAPKLFSELMEHFSGGDLPSDDTLRAYLVRRGFSEAALGDVIRSFRETMDLVSKEAGGYSATAREQGTDISMQQPPAASPQPTPPAGRRVGPAQVASPTPTVAIMDGWLEVHTALYTRKSVDHLITILNMVRGALPEKLPENTNELTQQPASDINPSGRPEPVPERH